MNIEENDHIEDQIEKAVALLFGAFYQLRKSEQYQREYDAMDVIIHMLMEDRQYLRTKYGVK